MHEFRKTEPINRTSSCRIRWGFPQRMADLFGTTGKPWTSFFRIRVVEIPTYVSVSQWERLMREANL